MAGTRRNIVQEIYCLTSMFEHATQLQPNHAGALAACAHEYESVFGIATPGDQELVKRCRLLETSYDQKEKNDAIEYIKQAAKSKLVGILFSGEPDIDTAYEQAMNLSGPRSPEVRRFMQEQGLVPVSHTHHVQPTSPSPDSSGRATVDIPRALEGDERGRPRQLPPTSQPPRGPFPGGLRRLLGKGGDDPAGGKGSQGR